MLRAEQIQAVAELIERPPCDLRSNPHLGSRSLQGVRRRSAELGLTLKDDRLAASDAKAPKPRFSREYLYHSEGAHYHDAIMG